MSDERLFCTFYIDGAYFGVDALHVQEVLRSQPMTSVPLSPSEVHGLINLRGQIVTAIDLRRRLGLPDRTDTNESMNVVVRTDDGPVSFLVDEIGDVIEVGEDGLDDAPETVGDIERELIAGIHQMDAGLLIILDVAAMARPMAHT